MKDLVIVCWKWRQSRYRSAFGPEQVRVLRDMIKRNLSIPHRFLCITDDATGLDDIETMPLWSEPDIKLPNGKPNCYRRLRAFSRDARHWLGERIVSIDLDTVITSDITPLVDVPEDFKIWGDTAKNTYYNGGFWVMDAGARAHVWEEFTPNAPGITRRHRMVGSDQAWISYKLGPGEAKWTTEDGVYSFRNHLDQGKKPLPSDARIVFFHGHYDPWKPEVQRQNPWIKKYYY